MRVMFCPSGVGLGHVGRCIPIARKLELDNIKILFSTYREGLKYVQNEGFNVVKSPDIGVAVKPDGSIDFRKTTVNPGPFITIHTIMKQIDAEINFMQSFKPDVVVSDSRASSLLAAKFLGIPRICILNQFQVFIPRRTRFLKLARIADATTMTFVGRIWADTIYALIPDFPPPYTISNKNLHIPKAYHKKMRFICPILPVTSADLPEIKQLRKNLGLDDDKSIIFAPISGPAKERAYFTGILRKILTQFPENYQIVMSLGYPNNSVGIIKNGNLIIHGWLSNRFEYMKASDVIVSRGGHGTISQSICFGRPMVLIPTPSHTEQFNNSKKAVELGVAEIIRQENLGKELLLAKIRYILDSKTILNKANQLQKDINCNGLTTAVKTIKEAVNKKDNFI
ncbi:MAG: glycosyltransferase [Candidatus Bathyarchaeota archaeon]